MEIIGSVDDTGKGIPQKAPWGYWGIARGSLSIHHKEKKLRREGKRGEEGREDKRRRGEERREEKKKRKGEERRKKEKRKKRAGLA